MVPGMESNSTPDRFESLSRAGNTQGDGAAMAALWDAAFSLETWFLVGRRVESGGEIAFSPLTAEIDGVAFAAAFTDRRRAEAFLAEQPERAEAVELAMFDAVEWLVELALSGAARGVIFNDGSAPFLAEIAD
ncbi:MAG: hypothetical protein AAGF47_11570, partial [Planctomycetota bacterium]